MLSAAGGPSDISKTVKWTKLIVHDEDGAQVGPAVPKYVQPIAISEENDEIITQEINKIKNSNDGRLKPLLINHSDATTPRMSER